MITHRLALIAGVATALAVVPAAAAAGAGQGGYTTIDVPGATATFTVGVNDAGVVVGWYTDSHGTNHGFIDQGGVFTTVNDPHAGTAAGQGTVPVGITNSGVIAGSYIDAGNVSHGFIDRGGVFTTVDHPHAGTAAGQGTFLGSINDLGAVSGTYFTSHGKAISFAGPLGAFTTVDDPAAAPFSTFAAAINDSGVIVGGDNLFTHRVPRRVIDQAGVFTTLYDPNAGTASGQGTAAQGISNTGVIVGIYVDSSGGQHGFELSPSR